jgi:hypothetical protein
VDRRSFLKGCAHVGTVGTLAKRRWSSDGSLDVRVWLSERAAERGDAGRRAVEYLELAFGAVRDDVTVSRGGTVTVRREHGYEVMQRGEWPGAVATGLAGDHGVDPVDDVNLLVTDGAMDTAPTGTGGAHVAAVGGAQALAAMPPADSTAPVVPYSTPARVTQVLLHECGHALGLSHDHGTVERRDDAVVATPMLSSYAWTGSRDRGGCGDGSEPAEAAAERRLSFLFSDCAAAEIAAYNGETRLPEPSPQ